MSKLAVFDVDGTILNSYTVYERAVEAYSRENGLPMPCLDTIKRGYGDPHNHDFKWGVPVEEQVRHLFGTFNLTDTWTLSGEPDKTPHFFDGVEQALTHLKDLGYTLGIVTSKPEAPLLHLLEYHNMGRFFSGHRTWDDIKRRNEKEKPQPDMLHSLMRELGFAPDETVMVGDTTMDIRMGRAAKTGTVGVTWGTHTKDDLSGAGAHHVIETHFDDVIRAINGFFS